MKRLTLIRGAVGLGLSLVSALSLEAQIKMPQVSDETFAKSNLQVVLDGTHSVGIISREYLVVDGVGRRVDLFYLPKSDRTIDLSRGYNLSNGEVILLDEKSNLMSKSAEAVDWQGALYLTPDGKPSYTPIADAKDATTKPYLLTDKRGEEVEQYALVKVGAQVWMRENLRTALLSDGTPLLTGLDRDKWTDAKTSAVAYYDNDVAKSRTERGALYNWYAVKDSKGLAPMGWGVPSVQDWERLAKYLDPKGAMTYDYEIASLSYQGGALLKSKSLWSAPKVDGGKTPLEGSNASMLDMRPYGSTSTSKYFNGFSGLGHQAYFWTKDESDMEDKKAMFIRLFWDSNTINCYFDDKLYGYSVRCLAQSALKLEEDSKSKEEPMPNVTFTIGSDLGEDADGEEIDELALSFFVGADEANTHIQIDWGAGKEDYTIAGKDPASITHTVDAGATIRIYGPLSLLDLSGNKKIVRVDFGENPSLQTLRLSQNEVASLDLSKLKALRELAVTDNKLKTLNVENLSALTELYAGWNPYSQLILAHNPALEVLTCYHTALTSLDVTKNAKLRVLTAGENRYEQPIDLSANVALEVLDLEESALKSIDLSPLTNLRKILFAKNDLQRLDITRNAKLSYVDVRKNQLDGCAINDILINLPQGVNDDEHKSQVGIALNPGADKAQTELAALNDWQIDTSGSGEGCRSIRIQVVDNQMGQIDLQVDGAVIKPMSTIERGKSVDILAKPIEGYKLDRVQFNGQEVAGLRIKADKYGYLTAIYTVHTAVRSVDVSRVSVVRTDDTLLIDGLAPDREVSIWTIDGSLVRKGKSDCDGRFVLRGAQSRQIYVIKQGPILIKSM